MRLRRRRVGAVSRRKRPYRVARRKPVYRKRKPVGRRRSRFVRRRVRFGRRRGLRRRSNVKTRSVMKESFILPKTSVTRSDAFFIAVGVNGSPGPATGFIAFGTPLAAALNASWMVRNLPPLTADGDQKDATVADPTGPHWADNSNYMWYHNGQPNASWLSVAPSWEHVSFFNANNFGVKLNIGPFYRWKRGYMPSNDETLLNDAVATTGSGALVVGTVGGPGLDPLKYNGVHMDRMFVESRYGFNKESIIWKRKLSIRKRYISVLVPPNGRYEFNIRLPGVKKVPYPQLLAEWNSNSYKYVQCCFKYQVFSPAMFDPLNAAPTAWGTGPGWGLTQVVPCVAMHFSNEMVVRHYVSNTPFFFIDSNPRKVARGATPGPAFNSQAVVEQKGDNAMF